MMSGDAAKVRYGVGRAGRVVVARLAPGCDLLEAIQGVVEQEGIGAGVVVSGVASLNRAVLRNVLSRPKPFPITDANRVYTPREETLELIALTGNVAVRDGRAVLHLHFVVSSGRESGNAYGGHLIPGCEVMSTGEVVILEVEGLAMRRRLDPETRAPELFFDSQ